MSWTPWTTEYKPDYVLILEEMYENMKKEIPAEVLSRVERVNQIVGYAGGQLSSRQIIATIIEQYERDMVQRAHFHEN